MTNTLALLPIDNRPVSYLLPKQIIDFTGYELILPERSLIGGLKTSSQSEKLEQWIKNLKNVEAFIVSLDSWVYGGLVQSRIHNLSLDDLKNRMKNLSSITNFNKYCFSSIMRIPSYNNSDEEKDYWNIYGEKIYKWSELMHRLGSGTLLEGETNEDLIEKWYLSSKEIPTDIMVDFKSRRDKNFTINVQWLKELTKPEFKYLVYSCDDSAQYGLNVSEANGLKKQIRRDNLQMKSKVISGTDEIPLILITKAIIEKENLAPEVSLIFSNESGKNEIAKYESNTIYSSICDQLDTLRLNQTTQDKSNIIIFVHVSASKQGDHIFGDKPVDTRESVLNLLNLISQTNKPFILIDLAYANGADPVLIEELINSKINWNLCYGFAAWNTCSNSTGTALSMGVNRWISEQKSIFNPNKFRKALVVRFLDDYAYQSKIRYSGITEEELNNKIKPYVNIFSKIFNLGDVKVKCTLPWKRSFEVEIDLEIINDL